MKRILKHVGILTFSNTVNYGASLQACALRRAVESLGCDCEILNYSNRELDDRELGTHFSFSPSGAARYFLRRVRTPQGSGVSALCRNQLESYEQA